jgi:selenocysteine lyase/cysteine desulfurase
MSWSAESIRNQYSRFLDAYPYTLFANHSHQAWPNVAKFGHIRAFDMAADNHGAKWHEVEAARNFLKSWLSKLISNEDKGGAKGICWGQNTFDLVGSFLSSLELKEGDVVITSDAEFHSMRRLLQAYEKRGVKVIWVRSWTEEEAKEGSVGRDFFKRVEKSILDQTEGSIKAIMFSSVSFMTGSLLPDFYENLGSLLLRNIPVLVDTYHHLGPLPFKVPSLGEENLYVVGGGYKYMQMGEGNCWMRAPLRSNLNPVQTGWFAEFEEMESGEKDFKYPVGAERFRGATYEPTSVFRGQEVAKFFDGIGFDPESLSKKYSSDVTEIYERLDRLVNRMPESYRERKNLYLLSHKDENLRAGFVALHFEDSALLKAYLEKHFIDTDYRGSVIRFGPAPYTLKSEINKLLDLLTEFFEGEL